LPALSPSASDASAGRAPTPRPGAARRDRLLVPVAGLCLLIGTAAYLMVFTMLGQIAAALNVSGTLLGWIVIATIITGTLSAALFPALGAVVGQRRLMLAAMGLLAAGSVISAIAPDGAVLLAGRIVAAPGFAASALSIAIVREQRSGPGLARSFGVIAAFAGVAAGVGFALGGAVEQAAPGDWRAVFAVMAAASAIVGLLAAAAIPARSPGRAGAARRVDVATAAIPARSPGRADAPRRVDVPDGARRVDVPGALLLAGGLVAALLPITQGASWGWSSWRVTGLLAVAVVLLAAWAATALRRPDPLVRLGVLALPGVADGTVLFVVTAATVGIVNLTVPPFLEAPPAAGYGGGASVLDAGLDLLPFALAITVSGYLAGRLARRVSPRLIAVVTLGCEAVALGLLAAPRPATATVVILIALFGIGHGGTLAVEYVLLTGAVPSPEAGGATGLAVAAGGISGAVASAVTTALLAATLVRAGPATLPAAADYGHGWLCGAAVATAGAAYTWSRAVRARRARRSPAS
jgi:MFS family permease